MVLSKSIPILILFLNSKSPIYLISLHETFIYVTYITNIAGVLMDNIYKLLVLESQKTRQLSLAMALVGGGGHLAPAFSITEICNVLYNNVMRPKDRFVLSKGHGCLALYSILVRKGLVPVSEIKKYCRTDGILGGHPDRNLIDGVEASTGSLGHGIVMAVGIAKGNKLQGKDSNVYCLIGDGEAQEGSVWEALLFAGNHSLNNLTVILDYNKLQGMGEVNNISSLEPLVDKGTAFGFETHSIDGHDVNQIRNALSTNSERPKLIIANTVKGKGIQFMEGVTIWHYKIPKGEQLFEACRSLGLNIQSNEDAIEALIQSGTEKLKMDSEYAQ